MKRSLAVVVAAAALLVSACGSAENLSGGDQQATSGEVVVGSADPVGLSRLARGLVDLREVVGPAPVHVVVNRMRASLGWSEKEVAGMK